MNSDTSPALWIKDPLAILADGAERGIVVQDGRIVELVGGRPRTARARGQDLRCRRARGAARADQHASSFLSDADPRGAGRARPRIVSVAASALSALGAADAGGGRSCLDARHGRADAVRLHADHGPSLRLSQRRRRRHRHPGRSGEAARLARAADARLDEPLAARRRIAAGQRGAGRRHDPRRL